MSKLAKPFQVGMGEDEYSPIIKTEEQLQFVKDFMSNAASTVLYSSPVTAGRIDYSKYQGLTDAACFAWQAIKERTDIPARRALNARDDDSVS